MHIAGAQCQRNTPVWTSMCSRVNNSSSIAIDEMQLATA